MITFVNYCILKPNCFKFKYLKFLPLFLIVYGHHCIAYVKEVKNLYSSPLNNSIMVHVLKL